MDNSISTPASSQTQLQPSISNNEETSSSSSSSPITTKINSTTEITNQSKPHKLDIHLISLLEGLNERKTRIDQQAQFLSNLPKILPFEPLAPASSDISSKTWEKWWLEHDRIEREADIFREDEFALMKKVAMSKTTNMSREDTDLVGLTLGTLEAFSRLEHLLRSRRKQLQILDLRIKWDQQTKKLKTQLDELQQERPKLISRIRWSPPNPDHSTPVTTPTSTPTPSSPLLRQSLGSQSRSPILSSQPTFPRSRQESVSHQHKPRISSTRLSISSVHHPQPDTDHTNGETCMSLDQTHTPMKVNSDSKNSIDGQYRTPSPTYSGRITVNPESSMSVRTHRSSSSSNRNHSLPTTPTPSTPLPTSIHSPLISSQSRAMRIQSLTLQLSSISTKLSTLNRLVIPTSATIDRLIDSGLHLPEAFLDEQDRLEASVRTIMSSDIGRFYATLLDQYKQADEIWYHQRSLENEVEIMKREIESEINTNKISSNHKPKFSIVESKLNSIIKTHESHSKRIQLFSCLPTHEFYPDQDQINQALINHLKNGLQRSQQRLDQLIELVNLYRLAVDRIEKSKEIRSAMEASKMRFKTLIEDIETLDRSQSKGAEAPKEVTSTLDIELGVDALEGSSSDASDQAWYKIEKKLQIELELAFKLLENAETVLIELNGLGIDPKIKSDTKFTKHDLRKQTDEIEELIRLRTLQIERLKLVRDGWKSLIKAEKEVKRLRTKLIWEIGRLKWKKLMKIEEERSSRVIVGDDHLHRIPRVPGLLSDAEEKKLEDSKKEKVKEEERLLEIASSQTSLLKDHTEARQLIETDLELLISSILAQLPNQPIIHSKFSELHDLLKKEKLGELERLERIRESIKLQTQEVQNLDDLQEGLMIEGSRLIKRVQDTIGGELDRTYEITSQSMSNTDTDTTTRHRRDQGETSVNRGRNRLVTKVKEYVPELESLVKSLPARIKFMVEENEGLEIKSYETEIKNFLNGIEMSLLGLRDQLCNEFSLLEWIDCEVGKRFSNGIEDVKVEIKDVIDGMEKVEDRLNGWMQLINSDRMQAAIPEVEIQAQCHQLITSLTNKLNQEIRSEIDERIPKSLEDFIHQCPSLSSNLFKPDQFILPKQMLQHQLQSYFNSTVRRSEDLTGLRNKFVEINQQRQLEFEWREGWKNGLNESMISLTKFEDGMNALSLDLGEIESQVKSWVSNHFTSRSEITLIGDDCQAPFPDFQSEVGQFKNKIELNGEGKMVELKNLFDEVNLKVGRIEKEIKEKLPLDDHLLKEPTTYFERLQPEWESAQNQMKALNDLMDQLQSDLDVRRSEHDLRTDWSARCNTIFKESDIADLMEKYEITLDQALLDNDSLAEDADDRFSKALEDLRSLINSQTAELTQIDQTLQLMKSKISEISKETLNLSQMPDIEHSYLIKAESELLRITSSFEKVSSKSSEVERRAIGRIVEGAGEIVQMEEMGVDQFVIAHQIGLEASRVKSWIESELNPFMKEVEEESTEIHKLESLSTQIESGSKAKIKNIGLNSSTSSTSSARLNEENDRLKQRFLEIKRLVAMTSKSHENLTRLELDLPRIVDRIHHFENTLPVICLSDLSHGIDQTNFKSLFQETEDMNRIKKLRIELNSITAKVNKMLEGTEEGMKLCKQQKARSTRMLEIMDRLVSLDLDRWVREPEKRHSPLPTRETVTDIQDRLEGINLEILDLVSELESVSASREKDESLLERCVKEYDSASSKFERLKELMEFNEAVETCDQSFSRLLDALDHHQNNGSEDDELYLVNQESETKVKEVSMKACGVGNDGRVEYQLERLTQTWAELSEMVKDRDESKNDSNERSNEMRLNGTERSDNYIPQSFLMKKNNSPASKIPVLLDRSPVRLRSNSVGSAAGSPSRMTSKIPSISTPLGPTETRGGLKRSLDHHAHPNSPYMSSPSLAASCRAGRRTPDPRSASKDQFDSHPPSSGFTRTRAPSSLRGRISGGGSGLRNRVSLMSMNQSRTAFGLSTPPSTRMDGIEKKRVQYRAQPNRNIDQMVGKVVNRLAVEVHVAPVEETWEDNSGLYWIGNKMYFCRILRSQTVMVRIGGGWNELSSFLLEHSKQAVAVTPLRADGLSVGGSQEKWMTSNEARRASTEHTLLANSTATATQALSTPRTRTLSAHPMAISTPPEAIQLYLRKAEVLKITPTIGSPTPNSLASISAAPRRHWRP